MQIAQAWAGRVPAPANLTLSFLKIATGIARIFYAARLPQARNPPRWEGADLKYASAPTTCGMPLPSRSRITSHRRSRYTSSKRAGSPEKGSGIVLTEKGRLSLAATDRWVPPGKFRRRDLICPLEFRFDGGGVLHVSDPESIPRWTSPYLSQDGFMALQDGRNIMRSGPCRTFSLGASVHGTAFHIWLLCRTAPFTFLPFDWFEVSPVFVLWVLTYLTFPRSLVSSSGSSSHLPHPPRQTLVSTRTSRTLAESILPSVCHPREEITNCEVTLRHWYQHCAGWGVGFPIQATSNQL